MKNIIMVTVGFGDNWPISEKLAAIVEWCDLNIGRYILNYKISSSREVR